MKKYQRRVYPQSKNVDYMNIIEAHERMLNSMNEDKDIELVLTDKQLESIVEKLLKKLI